jgi:hypothetical protein
MHNYKAFHGIKQHHSAEHNPEAFDFVLMSNAAPPQPIRIASSFTLSLPLSATGDPFVYLPFSRHCS